jgi:transglutaminase-like putative cysteine protease
MRISTRTVALLAASFLAPLARASTPAGADSARTYHVRQTVALSDIPAGASKVRWWVAIPDDRRAQQVLDFAVVSAPGAWRIERELEHGNRLLYVEVDKPGAAALETVVEFTLRREPIRVEVDPAKVGELGAEQRKLFADELELDAPHMQVTPEIRALAEKACGEERNPAVQATKLLEWVAANADHYSKDPKKPNCGVGDAAICLTQGGGCCTDLHSLFIALARARGIPARLEMGYRLQEKNLGKEVDPGYRCWPEYFLAGYGWVPADIVESDNATDAGERARWLTGLSERRLWLNWGREFELVPKQAGPRVNTLITGYAEIDGVPARVLPDGDKKPQLSRKVLCTEIAANASAVLPRAPAK